MSYLIATNVMLWWWLMGSFSEQMGWWRDSGRWGVTCPTNGSDNTMWCPSLNPHFAQQNHNRSFLQKHLGLDPFSRGPLCLLWLLNLPPTKYFLPPHPFQRPLLQLPHGSEYCLSTDVRGLRAVLQHPCNQFHKTWRLLQDWRFHLAHILLSATPCLQ